MRLGRHLTRLTAAMIVTIIAYAAPSVAWAHAGHVHDRPHDAAVEWALAAVEAPETEAPAFPANDLQAPAQAGAEVDVLGRTVKPAASLNRGGTGTGRCLGTADGACCGTMACCLGIPAGPASLPTRAFGHVKPIACDVAGLPGIGPEALPRPPRPPA